MYSIYKQRIEYTVYYGILCVYVNAMEMMCKPPRNLVT